MSDKTKNNLRKIVYFVLFAIMICCFIYLGEKYADNSQEKILTINDYYNDLDKKKYEVIRGNKFISLLKKGKNLIFIGNKNSEYSQKYIEELDKIVKELDINKIYYYDIVNDKAQKNSNYYEIRELLKGYLTTTDDSKNNLLAPSFYIIEDGKVRYYNIDTVAMKNTETIENYWDSEKEFLFKTEITEALNKYYLN